jgi:uncharacterized protein GlcG (DUF336 family)
MRLALGLLLAIATAAAAEEATFTVRQLTPETALVLAQAAMQSCRKQGFQVAVAVTDRSGVVQVLLRDRFAGPHTVDTAIAKAWTAVSFRTSTRELMERTAPNKPASGIRHLPRVAAIDGGAPVEAQGSILGAVGVSGAPCAADGRCNDADCAEAGIKAIAERLEF